MGANGAARHKENTGMARFRGMTARQIAVPGFRVVQGTFRRARYRLVRVAAPIFLNGQFAAGRAARFYIHEAGGSSLRPSAGRRLVLHGGTGIPGGKIRADLFDKGCCPVIRAVNGTQGDRLGKIQAEQPHQRLGVDNVGIRDQLEL